MSRSVIVIGGGLGGLFTGALLAKEGFAVSVFEKNDTIGGGLQTFSRKGFSFETGMHILGGLREGGSIYKICRYLEVMDKIRVSDVDHDCIDSITYLSDGKTYRIPEGRDAFTEYLISEFPDEKDNIKAYVTALYDLTEEVDFFYLREGKDSLFSHSEQFLWPADEFIAHYVKNPKLRDLLAYMNPMYGGVKGHTPAYVHALINVLYINGPSRFVGGSQQLADALADIITEKGGNIYAGEGISHIHVTDHMIDSVETTKGNRYHGDFYISAIHPCSLLKITDNSAFPKSYRDRINGIQNTYSAFTLYIIFKENMFPYINHTCYFQDDYGMVWDHGEYDASNWPRGFMYMTPNDVEQGRYATKMIVNCIMNYETVRRWEDTTVGHRGKEYEKWKQSCSDMIINKLERLHPGFKYTIDTVYSSSPLTIRDYYNEKEGALYGVMKDCRNIVASQIPVYTKVRNLYLTGQNINLHGFCGVPLTAINTVEAIIGNNKLINKINLYNDAYGKD